ncbi:hypothetical protein [Deinococcus hopiensis]|uniref:Uncharacterized protein n=1 Tax=Deinococcus hopiensis KR-140 TaxID=695939 RepID=A0A1W1UWU4_9DEIO|nr:hypothetical protein [Deinococcus hopiensis]SMB85563.1 hypothetical protein SAMN00790413_03446 [Deinococcus hopiensis KR-140]
MRISFLSPLQSRVPLERQLYHAQRVSGEWATMSREEGSCQWRQLRGGGDDGYGRGSWREMHAWLAK